MGLQSTSVLINMNYELVDSFILKLHALSYKFHSVRCKKTNNGWSICAIDSAASIEHLKASFCNLFCTGRQATRGLIVRDLQLGHTKKKKTTAGL